MSGPGEGRDGRWVRIRHRPSGTVLAEGPLGWGITPFEGNYYVRRRYLERSRFAPAWVPGLCIYKFLYVWMDVVLADASRVRMLAWLYWLPNPLLPFIWFRVAIPGSHPDVQVDEVGLPGAT